MEKSVSLHEVESLWPKLIRMLRSRDLKLQALMRSGEPIETRGRTVFIRFEYEFHTEEVSKELYLNLLESALEELLDQAVCVSCLLPNEPLPKPPIEYSIHLDQLPDTIKEEILLLESEKEELSIEVAQLEESVRQRRDILERLDMQVESQSREAKKLKKKVSDLKEEIQQLNSSIQVLEEENNGMKRAARELQTQQEESQHSLQNEISKLKTRRDELSAEISPLEEELQCKIENLERRREDLAAEVSRLEHRLKSNRGSTADVPPVPGLENIIGGTL